ncbi:MAG: hypothetical protein ABL999_01900 [Pyrinomonadaceae bacterium]
MKNSRYLVFLCLFVFAVSAFGQKDKPYQKWGKEETLRLFNDSAWAKPYQSNIGQANAAAGQIQREQGQSVNRGGSDPRSVARDFGPPPVTMRLHSALPIRQAIVRLQQIDIGYDKMSDADKAAFDKSKEGYLKCVICTDYYVITLMKAPDASKSTVEEGIFQGMTLAELKGNIKLVNEKGEERELIEFNAPKGPRDQTVFYFKRLNDAGVPLFTADSKEIKFVFSPTFLDSKNRFAYLLPRTFEFKASKMVVDNVLIF